LTAKPIIRDCLLARPMPLTQNPNAIYGGENTLKTRPTEAALRLDNMSFITATGGRVNLFTTGGDDKVLDDKVLK